jgi:hypothetical protein
MTVNDNTISQEQQCYNNNNNKKNITNTTNNINIIYNNLNSTEPLAKGMYLLKYNRKYGCTFYKIHDLLFLIYWVSFSLFSFS